MQRKSARGRRRERITQAWTDCRAPVMPRSGSRGAGLVSDKRQAVATEEFSAAEISSLAPCAGARPAAARCGARGQTGRRTGRSSCRGWRCRSPVPRPTDASPLPLAPLGVLLRSFLTPEARRYRFFCCSAARSASPRASVWGAGPLGWRSDAAASGARAGSSMGWLGSNGKGGLTAPFPTGQSLPLAGCHSPPPLPWT